MVLGFPGPDPHDGKSPAAPRTAAGFLLPGRYRQPGQACASLIAGGAPSACHLNTLAPPGFPLVGLFFPGIDTKSPAD